jgi:RNA polymerase sigma factor (sigma-70 family)
LLHSGREQTSTNPNEEHFQPFWQWWLDHELSINVSPSVPATGLDTAYLESLADRMGAALAQIPVEQRQTLELAYYGGLSQSTIANQLDIPLGTVKTRSRQGLLKLKTLLQDLL